MRALRILAPVVVAVSTAAAQTPGFGDPNRLAKLSATFPEIDRVYRAYPHLNDDAFVAEHLDEWMGA